MVGFMSVSNMKKRLREKVVRTARGTRNEVQSNTRISEPGTPSRASSIASSALQRMVSPGTGAYSERMFPHTELFPVDESKKLYFGTARPIKIYGR